MREIRCEKCGCALERAGEEYVCYGCGARFEEENVKKAAEALAAVLDEQKQEAVANLRQLLWKELHEEYIDADAVARLAREIKKYLPEDYLANFCEVACGAGGKKLNKFLRKTDVKKQSMYVWDVLDLMFHILREENLLAVNDFLSRALEAGADAQKYARYNARLIEESKKINAGVYDAALPRDAFIAYSSEDMEQVSELVEELEGQKISCFVAARNLQHGKVGDYEEKLEEAMKRCKVFVFVSGSHSRSRTCDALEVEMEYIRKLDLKGAPVQYRNYYKKMPKEYKKPRVEYMIERYSGKGAAEQITEEFFAGCERCWRAEEVAERILEYIARGPAPQVKYCLACGAENASKAKFCSECGGRTFAATREQVEEEKSERERLAQEKQRAEEERRKAEEEKRKVEEEKRKAEAEKRKAEAEKRKAEEEKRKVEEEAAAFKAQLERLQRELEQRSAEQAAEKQRAEEEEKEVPSSQGREQGENTFEKYKKAAEQGDADAQYNLGICYDKGDGVAQSYAEAVKWYKKAAEQGYAGAQNSLGNCYYNGNGVKQSYLQAVKWYKNAAEQGHAGAQNSLGNCYYKGNGVEQSYAEAVKW